MDNKTKWKIEEYFDKAIYDIKSVKGKPERYSAILLKGNFSNKKITSESPYLHQKVWFDVKKKKVSNIKYEINNPFKLNLRLKRLGFDFFDEGISDCFLKIGNEFFACSGSNNEVWFFNTHRVFQKLSWHDFKEYFKSRFGCNLTKKNIAKLKNENIKNKSRHYQ